MVVLVVVVVVVVVVAAAVVIAEKKILSHPTMGGVMLRLPGFYQSPESLRTRRRTCAVLRRTLFWSSTSLIVPGIWASQPSSLS